VIHQQEANPHLKNFALYVLLIFGIIIGTIYMFSSKPKTENRSAVPTLQQQITNMPQPQGKYKSVPEMKIDENKKYTADIVTNMGNIEVELFSKEAPITVNNFVFLSKDGFYNGTIFHRIVKDFMIQGGDPLGTGMGGPGYKFPDEKITRDYKRGIVAMANSGPDTNGSQFFIMLKDTPLPKNYVIFGYVTKGMETVDKIAQIPAVDNGYGEQSKPTKEAKIEKITILE
jgi:cyclophilin family peptidyl-prolyl cis-trans isomerase